MYRSRRRRRKLFLTATAWELIKLLARGSITKTCGPFYEKFPKALAEGIKAQCTQNACFLSKPGAMKIKPYEKVACLKRTWQVSMEEVEEDPDWQAVSFKDYNEFKNNGGLARVRNFSDISTNSLLIKFF